ncbi:hypothetical protein EDC04DRAFT_2889913 [Pisolithus marmoratus]|nr:hypothetical protein EDC04DRAFT_2889913 [Pisolithus marmoratus]
MPSSNVNVGTYAIRTLDGRPLAYGSSSDVRGTVPPPPRPVCAYPSSSPVQPQEFEISQVEQDTNRYYISYLINVDGLLYDQVTAPQRWIITLAPRINDLVFVIQTEDGQAWVAPPPGDEGQIRVESIPYEGPASIPRQRVVPIDSGNSNLTQPLK